MLKRTGALLLALGVLAAGGYASGAAKPRAAKAPATKSQATPTINDSMTHVMAPEAQTIWDISSKAFNKKGDGLDARKLTAQDWAFLGESGRRLKARATLLASAKHVVVAGPGEHIMGEDAAHGGVKKTWDAASPSQVQALIDANPKLFSEHAWTLARTGASLERAAKTRDIRTVYKVSAGLDEVCDGCHKPFWGTDDPPPPPKGLRTLMGR